MVGWYRIVLIPYHGSGPVWHGLPQCVVHSRVLCGVVVVVVCVCVAVWWMARCGAWCGAWFMVASVYGVWCCGVR